MRGAARVNLIYSRGVLKMTKKTKVRYCVIKVKKGKPKVFRGFPGSMRLWCGNESLPFEVKEVNNE